MICCFFEAQHQHVDHAALLFLDLSAGTHHCRRSWCVFMIWKILPSSEITSVLSGLQVHAIGLLRCECYKYSTELNFSLTTFLPCVYVGMGLLIQIRCARTTFVLSWQCLLCGMCILIILCWRLLHSFRTSTSCKIFWVAVEPLQAAKRSLLFVLCVVFCICVCAVCIIKVSESYSFDIWFVIFLFIYLFISLYYK